MVFVFATWRIVLYTIVTSVFRFVWRKRQIDEPVNLRD